MIEPVWAPAYPVVTDRLELRPHRREDIEDLLQFHSDPDVVRYVPWPVRDREQVRVALEAKLDRGRVDAEGQWLILAVVLAQTGQVIGEVLLKFASAADELGEIGFAFHRDFHGRGLAEEAARAVLELGFESFGLHRIIGICIADNVASARLMTRLGMRREAHFVQSVFWKGAWADDEVYAILASQWRAQYEA